VWGRRFAAEIWALTEHCPPIFQRAGAAAPIEKPIGGMTSVSSYFCGEATSLRLKFGTARRAVPTLGNEGEAALTVVDFAAVTDRQHEHGHFAVIDAVDDPVMTDTDSVAVRSPGQLAASGGAWV